MGTRFVRYTVQTELHLGNMVEGELGLPVDRAEALRQVEAWVALRREQGLFVRVGDDGTWATASGPRTRASITAAPELVEDWPTTQA